MKLTLLLLFAALAAFAQNPGCPAATGTSPHCVVLNWVPASTGPAPTGFNVYTGGTAAGKCSTVTAATCSKVGTVSAGVLTLTQNTNATTVLMEGATYFYVVTAVNGTAESVPSVEVSAVIPFLLPSSPSTVSAVAH